MRLLSLTAVRPWPEARPAEQRMPKGARLARRQGPHHEAPSFPRAGHSAIRVQHTNGPRTVWKSAQLRQVKGKNVPSRARCYRALPRLSFVRSDDRMRYIRRSTGAQPLVRSDALPLDPLGRTPQAMVTSEQAREG